MPRCRCGRLPLLLSLLASSTVAPALEAVDPVGGASGGSLSNPLSLPWLTNVAENQTSAAVGARAREALGRFLEAYPHAGQEVQIVVLDPHNWTHPFSEPPSELL